MSTMPSTSHQPPATPAIPADPSRAALTPTDLAELLSSFNEVTARLQSSHEQLRGEVARLSADLRDANEQLERSRRLAALGEMAAGIATKSGTPGSPSASTHIVGDVLRFARDLKPQAIECDAAEIFDVSVAACDAILRRGNVRVERTGQAEGTLLVDRNLVVQAITNLVRNAAEALDRVGDQRANDSHGTSPLATGRR